MGQNVMAILKFILIADQVTYHTEDENLPLNIFTSSLTGCLPVVLYVHGGGLLIGGSSSYDGHDSVLMINKKWSRL